MKAEYVSVWDGGTTITTICEYNPVNKVVSDIGSSDVEGLEICEDEYVLLSDGTEIRDFINEDDYEGEEDSDESTGLSHFTVRLEIPQILASSPLEAVKEMIKWIQDGVDEMVFDVKNDSTGKKFTVDMSEEEGEQVLPNNE